MVIKITKSKIIGLYLSNYGKKYYLRELADLLKKPHQTIKPYVEELVKERILIKNKRRKITDYDLNFNNKILYDYLVITEKKKFIEKLNENTLLRILFEKLSIFFQNNSFIIFGSAAEKLEKNSDIDLLIIGKTNMQKVINDFEEIYNKKIHKLQVNDLSKLTPALIKEIYKKHLILNNTEQILRFFGGLYEKNKLV